LPRYGLLEPGNGTFFLDNDRMMGEIIKVVEWANNWADVQYERHQAFKAGAQKRLEDVREDIVETQGELDAVEKGLVEIQSSGDGERQKVVEEFNRLEGELEHKRKIAQSVADALTGLTDEEEKLLSVKDNKVQRLTDAGKTRLEEVRAEMETRKARQEDVQTDLRDVEERYQALAEKVDFFEQRENVIKEKEQLFQEKRDALRALEEKQNELGKVVEQYENANLPSPEQRKTIVEKGAEPLLGSLRTISWVAGKAKVMDGRIRSETFLKVK